MELKEEIKIPEEISIFINRDKNTYAFYDMISPLSNPLDFQNSYIKVNETSDLVTISEEQPFPSILINAITPFTTRVFFGTLPAIDKFYCIVDNSVYFWSTNSKSQEVDYYVEEKHSIISFVSSGIKNSKVFKDEVTAVIIYGGDDFLRIVPVTEKVVGFDSSVFVNLSIIPMCSHTTDTGIIFIGADDGDIYRVKYDFLNDSSTQCTVKVENMTRKTFLQKIKQLLQFTSPILQLAYDEESQILATLDRKSLIYFYKVTNDTLLFLSKFDPTAFDGLYNNILVSIQSIPKNFDSTHKFVAYYTDGARLCFSVDSFINIVSPSVFRYPPPFLPGDAFFMGTNSISHCIFVCEKSIVVTKENHKINENDGNVQELYCIIPFDCDLLSLSNKLPNIPPTKLVNHPLYWQHIFSPQPSFLISVDGTRILNFRPSYEKLAVFINDEENIISKEIYDLAKDNIDEFFASALLLATKQPNKKEKCLLLIMTLAQQNEEVQIAQTNNNNLHFASSGFLIRLSRILAGIWSQPIFKEKNEDLFEINERYKKSQLNHYKEIMALKKLCDDYFILLRKSSVKKPLDFDRFPLLSNYMVSLSNTIRFLNIIEKVDNKVLTKALKEIDLKYRNRLITTEFGCTSRFAQPLFDSLHELCMKIYEKVPQSTIFDEIETECPEFFDKSDIIVFNSIKIIMQEDIFDNDILNKALDGLILKISRPMNIENICHYFKEKNFINGIFKLCMAKAENVDPTHLAHQWFHHGRSTLNSPGQKEFDERYKFYDIIFRFVEEAHLDLILQTDDELFHICFYYYLLENNQLKRAVSKTTPYLKTFLELEAPHLLWRYLASHQDYNKAAINLWNYLNNDNDLELRKRIKYLKICRRYSFSNSLLKQKIINTLKLALIQNELLERTNNKDDYGYYLLDARDLFIELAGHQSWDLLLRELSFEPVNSEKKFVVSQIWQNYFKQTLSDLRLQTTTFLIKDLFTHLCEDKNDNDVIDLSIIIPFLEEYKYDRNSPSHYGIKLLKSVGFNIDSLCDVYISILEDKYITDDVRCDLIDVVSFAITCNARPDKNKIIKMNEWLTEHGKSYPNFEKVTRTLRLYLM